MFWGAVLEVLYVFEVLEIFEVFKSADEALPRGAPTKEMRLKPAGRPRSDLKIAIPI